MDSGYESKSRPPNLKKRTNFEIKSKSTDYLNFNSLFMVSY